ncbi:hypothetical protein PENSPDRAFT_736874 [Peniophora sp. CONT]|nr:hypothetical protein PENSPDRAFT_736874 [Peniophora sp. CONT]
MAPSTRSRNNPAASQQKKRPAEDSDVESADTEDVKEKKTSRKPPAKRAKTTGPGKRAGAGKKKHVGKLGALPDMPLDILEEIFSLLNLSDLFSISRTTKAFRALLLKDTQFRPLWAQAWSRVVDYPACPPDVQLYKWLHLLFGGSYCHMCAASSVHRIHFSVRARICISCVKSNMLPRGAEYIQGTDRRVWHLIPTVVLTFGKDREERYVFPEDYTTLMGGIEEAESKFKSYKDSQRAVKSYVHTRYVEYNTRSQHVADCERWQDEISGRRADDIEGRRGKRRTEIAAKLRLLDYTDDDIASIWKLKDVNVAKPLTDRAWNNLLPTLLPTLSDERTSRLDKEYTTRYDLRLDAAHKAWFSLMQSPALHPRELPYLPEPNQCASLEPISRTLSEDVEVSVDWLARLQDACSEALVHARDIWTKRQLTAAQKLEAVNSNSVGAQKTESLDPMQALSRATSVFKVSDGQNRHRFGYEVLAEAQNGGFYFKSGTYDNETFWRHIEGVLPQGQRSVEAVLQHLGLGSNTTIHELDRLDPALTCITCVTDTKRHWAKGLVYGWRSAVWHVCYVHEKNTPEVRLRSLSDTERIDMASEIYAKSSYHGDRAWGCCHCTERMKHRQHRGSTEDYLMSRMAMDEHLKECHQISDPEEGVDHYWHPFFCRNDLLKGYGSTYRIQVAEKDAM